MPVASAPLKYLYPGWYAVVMGLCGLALAWQRAIPIMGSPAEGLSMGLGALAALAFALLAAATWWRARAHPQAWAEDRRHPVRHTFIASLPISVLLLATVAVALLGANAVANLAWWLGSLGLLWVTLWVLSRWWKGKGDGGFQWPSLTPALFVPIVGNALAPLAGVPLGHADWATAQFGVGLMFWPVVMILVLVRIATQGMYPQQLLPVTFIFIAPPTVVGLSAAQLGAPLPVLWGLWGMGMFTFVWVALLAKRIVALPFGLSHWGLSFPLAALAALTLRLAAPGTPMALLGVALLALTSVVVLWLFVATARGLRDGTLLVPEPVAAIVPVA